MIDDGDWLGLSDADELARKRPPAFLVGPPMGNEELRVAERLHLASQRQKEFAGATEPIFTIEDEAGVERLPIDQAAKWGAIMRWPKQRRLPTLEEVEQFQASRDNALYRQFWDQLREAVIKDAAGKAAEEKKRNDAIVAGFRR
jgi:hypothetical protein